MKLTIISVTQKEVFDITWIEVNTPNGNYVMQEGHAPMILTLSPNKPFIYALKNGVEESRAIAGGILHITRHEATLIIE